MRIFFIALLLLNASSFRARADEGMWLPLLLERLNYADMKKMGLNLTPEELYSINHASVKDAIVGMSNSTYSAGFFCTAEIISADGLMITNHHCGFGEIQEHSTTDHNYLDDGFWAGTRADELPCKDLNVKFLVRMEDVTARVLYHVSDSMSDRQRDAIIDSISGVMETEAEEDGKYVVHVNSFFEGNEYYRFVYNMYTDVRLVGAPPSGIGKFGGDTDNWMWPRHTGDFSLFRIYTGPDGEPADYNPQNIPLKPKHHLPISLKGYQNSDFSMIWGYPGGTNRYITSYGIQQALDVSNPTIVRIRDVKLAILKSDMNRSEQVRLQYASEYASLANYWKYFKGESLGLLHLDVLNKRKKVEEAFLVWLEQDEVSKATYQTVLPQLENNYRKLKPVIQPMIFYHELRNHGIAFIPFALDLLNLYKMLENKPGDPAQITAEIETITSKANAYFNKINHATEKKMFEALMTMLHRDIEPRFYPSVLTQVKVKYHGSIARYTDDLFSKSILSDQARFNKFLQNPKLSKLKKDPGFIATMSIISSYSNISEYYTEYETHIRQSYRLFVAGLREMKTNEIFYPNANSTMRYTYGKVADYYPADAVYYNYYTTLKGVMEKEDPTSDEFTVPEKLKTLYNNKDFGRYGENGEMHVCFITDHDITGGNSGSPVIDKDGHLIGLAFDGNWEGMSGDIWFEPSLQRTISVDIRYVLFIIDKFAGATHLIDELTIIE